MQHKVSLKTVVARFADRNQSHSFSVRLSEFEDLYGSLLRQGYLIRALAMVNYVGKTCLINFDEFPHVTFEVAHTEHLTSAHLRMIPNQTRFGSFQPRYSLGSFLLEEVKSGTSVRALVVTTIFAILVWPVRHDQELLFRLSSGLMQASGLLAAVLIVFLAPRSHRTREEQHQFDRGNYHRMARIDIYTLNIVGISFFLALCSVAVSRYPNFKGSDLLAYALLLIGVFLAGLSFLTVGLYHVAGNYSTSEMMMAINNVEQFQERIRKLSADTRNTDKGCEQDRAHPASNG